MVIEARVTEIDVSETATTMLIYMRSLVATPRYAGLAQLPVLSNEYRTASELSKRPRYGCSDTS